MFEKKMKNKKDEEKVLLFVLPFLNFRRLGFYQLGGY